MKKILIVILLFWVFVLVSCSNDESSETGSLEWSEKSSDYMTRQDAINYCENLPGGEWRLPTISEIRTLVQNCPAMEHPRPESLNEDKWCSVSDNCLDFDGCWEFWDDDCLSENDWEECWEERSAACDGCPKDSSGKYSVFGDSECLWTVSLINYEDGGFEIALCFKYAYIYDVYDDDWDTPIAQVYVRCVKDKN